MVKHYIAPYKFELEKNHGPADLLQCMIQLLQRGFKDTDNNTILVVKKINVRSFSPSHTQQLDYTIELQQSTQNVPKSVIANNTITVINNTTGNSTTLSTILNVIKGITPNTMQKLIVYGEIDYGKYNYSLDLIDTNLITIDTIIPPTKSPANMYFYMFYFISPRSGFLILERIGNIGVRTALQKAIKKNCSCMSEITPIVVRIREILESPVKKIKILRPAPSREKLLEELSVDNIEEVEQEIIFKAKKNTELSESLSNWELSNLARIVEENYGKEAKVSIEVKVGTSTRTIYINTGKFRSWVEIEPDTNRYNRAIYLIQEIEKEWVEPSTLLK